MTVKRRNKAILRYDAQMKRAASWLAMSAVFFAMVVALRLEGRLWVCSCGYVLAWSGNVNSADNSQHLFDPYSFTHVLHGFLFIALLHLLRPHASEIWKFAGALSVEMAWEALENTNFIIQRYRSETISLGYVGDTILNSFGDILACALGVVVARRIGTVRTIAVAGLIELLLLVTIRDSLLLNVIMLLYPIDAIRVWQSGH